MSWYDTFQRFLDCYDIIRGMKTLTLSDYKSLAELRYQIRCFLSFSEQAARAAGLEPRQHQLMLSLKGLPRDSRPTIGELAERLQKESSGDLKAAVTLGYQLTLGRSPSASERDRALTYIEDDPGRLKGFAWLLFNMDEFVYVR